MGADIVVHSMTKYLNGHSDVVGGIVITNNDSIAEKLCFVQNSVGAVPAPWDCFLVLRGLKTLHVRMDRHQENAKALVKWLSERTDVGLVRYPGFSGMISFELERDLDAAVRFVKATKLFTLAESLGGVESLIELPAIMTHASVPPEIRRELGITDGLIRLSVGIEHIDDLKADLAAAFDAAENE
jgi:cystathionine beta-lyase/cystathionine gamma-synthase